MPRPSPVSGHRVARSILLAFVLAALVPVAVLGILSFEQVNSQLDKQTRSALHKSCKDYAMGLSDRISLFESALRLLATGVRKQENGMQWPDAHQQARFERQFTHLAVIVPPDQRYELHNDAEPIPELSAKEIEALGSGKPLVKPVASGQQSPVWMAIALDSQHPERGILLAELNPGMLWQVDNIDSDHFWALGRDGHVLFAMDPTIAPPDELASRVRLDSSGQFSWRYNDASY